MEIVTSKEKQHIYLLSSESGIKYVEATRIRICGIKKALITINNLFLNI